MNLVLGLGLFHYLLERTTWKRAGLRRSQLSIDGSPATRHAKEKVDGANEVLPRYSGLMCKAIR